MSRIIATTALALLVIGCATRNEHAHHPLTDAIVHADSGAPMSRTRLAAAMSAAAVVYLGEKHDNRAHQQQQLWALNELIRRGHRPVVGFEIFATGDSGALMEYTSADQDTTGADARLRASTGMDNAADERWSIYGPALQLARTHELSIFGIDLPVALRRRISRVGISGLTPVEQGTLSHGDDGNSDGDTISPAYRASMLTRLKAAHCGYGDKAYLGRLLQNWQARNETMASAITAAASARNDSPVVVILGGGHVRGGEGVVPRVSRHMPGVRQLIVSFTEVDEALPDVEKYLSSVQSSHYEEVLWFTAAQGLSMDDACKAFRRGKK